MTNYKRVLFVILFAALTIFTTLAQEPDPANPETAPPAVEAQPDSSTEIPAPPPTQPAEEPQSPATLNLHQWGAVTPFHGLPSNNVRAIVQDADGLLWFGTDGGLARFDGRRTQKVGGLPAGAVRVLKLDNKGALWVGTDGGCAFLFNNAFQAIKETAGFAITDIGIDRDRILLTSDKGALFIVKKDEYGYQIEALTQQNQPLLNVYNRSTRGKDPLELTRVIATKAGVIIATRKRGLLTLNNDGSLQEIVSRPRAFSVEALATDNQGRLWFGADVPKSESGLFASEQLLKPVPVGTPNDVTALAFDREDNLWVTTREQGVYLYRNDKELRHFTFQNSAGGLRSDLVYTVFIDREGVVWFGTDHGVCRYDARSPYVELLSEDRKDKSNYVRSLYQSKDLKIWCGTNKGVFFRTPEARAWQRVDEIGDRSIHAIDEDSAGRILIGSDLGVYISTPPNEPLAFTRVTESNGTYSARALGIFRGSTYVASDMLGIEELTDKGMKLVWPVTTTEARQRRTISLYAEGNEQLWIGTIGAGVFIYDGRQVFAHPGLGELSQLTVRSITGNSREGLWFATDRGLYFFKNGKLEQVLKVKEARTVYAGSTAGTAWCATDGNGLYKVSLNDWKEPLIARIDTEIGLPSNKVFALFPGRGPQSGENYWIGTNKGLAFYQPSSIPPVLKATRVVGSRAYQPEELLNTINLEYPQNSLVIDVAAASSRTFPEHFLYSFMLLSANGKVIKQTLSPDAQLVVEDLNPGSYRVEARAYTNELVVSAPLMLQFTVAKAPFPWPTVALSILLALSLMALWWGYHQNSKLYSANTALAQANKQLAETKLQLANETENERKRIARDLHDQTLADLRHLMLLTDKLPVDKNNSQHALSPIAFRSEIEAVSIEIRRICEDLSPSVLSNVGLMAALEYALSSAVKDLPIDRKFDYQLVCDDDLEDRLNFDMAVQIQIYRIVQEAISNICKHAEARNVCLKAETDKDGLFIITMEDDGRGFKMHKGGTGRGLNNIRSRASMIEGEASWSPRPEGGTIFTFKKAGALKVYHRDTELEVVKS